MKFGPVSTDQAVGAILAHSVTISGQRLRKGRILTDDDVVALQGVGKAEVIVARLDPEDLGEDAAAQQIAESLVPDQAKAGLRLTLASTGRVNIYATGPGVLRLDVAAIELANRIDPMITIATLPPFALARAGGMVATVKIIAYGVAASAVEAAADLVNTAMHVQRPILKKASLIQTDIGTGPGKGADAMKERLSRLDMDLEHVKTVPHQITPLADAISASQSDMIMILTASATSDPNDVAPEAVRMAGGQVHRFGMPVDPGNLLFIGEMAGCPVIGLPGCARSPALNGADWVLERVACGIEVTDDDIAGMGVGGLLKESPARPHPRERSSRQ